MTRRDSSPRSLRYTRPAMLLFRFGDYELCPERYELVRRGTPVKLEPRVLEVLAYLVTHRERVVPKGELLDELWDGVAVSESALTRTIREVRRGLGALAGRRWIRTVYGRGFQFVAPVTALAEPDASSARPAAEAAAPPSVAVLPFADLSATGDQGHFCDGLAEELIGALTHIEGLSVASRTSAFQFRDIGADVRVIGARINVSTVLEGSVRKENGRLRISAQLIRVADDRHLWAAVFEREEGEVFTIQVEIAESIARALRVVLSDRERLALQGRPRAATGAYDWYLRGRQVSAEASGRTLEAGRQMFLRAVEMDPDFVLALTGLSDNSAWLYLYWGGSERELTAAEAASRRAVALAPDLAEAHVSRALVLMASGQLDLAQDAFEVSFRLNPRLYKPHYAYARLCWIDGRLPGAAHHLEQAERLNPDYPAITVLLAKVYDALGRKDDGAAARRRCLHRVERALGLAPDNVRALYLGATALAGLGEVERALEWADRACAAAPDDQVAHLYAAATYARAGRLPRALEHLERAVVGGCRHLAWIRREPDLEPLRAEPRYRELLTGRGPAESAGQALGAASLHAS